MLVLNGCGLTARGLKPCAPMTVGERGMKLGVAGIGKMGAAIGARLIEVGHDVSVWTARI
jgi:phosphoglycerate dehydrogenase-like enzyme